MTVAAKAAKISADNAGGSLSGSAVMFCSRVDHRLSPPLQPGLSRCTHHHGAEKQHRHCQRPYRSGSFLLVSVDATEMPAPNGVARRISYTSGAQASFRSILVR